LDDVIWHVVGLEDETDGIPAWLGHEEMQEGIVALLEVDRSREELACLIKEKSNMQTWFCE